jgi:uncharacterized RDD family membrane protein YckC
MLRKAGAERTFPTVNQRSAVKRARTYHAAETARMLALEGLPLASFARRGSAIVIDFVAVFALAALVAQPVGSLWERTHPSTHLKIVLAFGPDANWYSIAAVVTYFTLVVFATNGLTLGKRLCGIRVVSTVHERISLWHALERALGYVVSVGELGFGFVQYFTTSNCRTTHDRIAQTIVVRTSGDAAGTPAVVRTSGVADTPGVVRTPGDVAGTPGKGGSIQFVPGRTPGQGAGDPAQFAPGNNTPGQGASGSAQFVPGRGRSRPAPPDAAATSALPTGTQVPQREGEAKDTSNTEP